MKPAMIEHGSTEADCGVERAEAGGAPHFEGSEHPLARELREMLDQPNGHAVADFARVLGDIMREMSALGQDAERR